MIGRELEAGEIEIVRQARLSGLALAEIRECLEAGVSYARILAACEGLPSPRQAKRETVIAAVKGGMTYREAHEEFGVALKSVYFWCRHLGLRRCPKYRRQRALAQEVAAQA